jgi:hypothetical protein
VSTGSELVRQVGATVQRVESGAITFRTIDPEVREVIRAYICDGATDGEIELFLANARQRGLSVFNNQLWAIRRRTKVKVERNGRAVEEERWGLHPQTGIAGYRLIAQRTGLHDGTTEPEFSADGEKWSTVWTQKIDTSVAGEPGHPAFARVTVHRRDKAIPTTVTTTWEEATAQSRYNGKVQGKWREIPLVMFGYAPERYALRKAFPEDLGDIGFAEGTGGPPAQSVEEFARQVSDGARTLGAGAEATEDEPAWKERYRQLVGSAELLGVDEDTVRATLRDQGLERPSELTADVVAAALRTLAGAGDTIDGEATPADEAPAPEAVEAEGQSDQGGDGDVADATGQPREGDQASPSAETDPDGLDQAWDAAADRAIDGHRGEQTTIGGA